MTFDEFFELIQSPLVEGEGIIRMWRGQSDISWPLHSSAYRRLSLEIKEPNEKKIINYEKNLLQSATHKGFRYLDGRRLSDFDLLARLQHHGAATRLIDATRLRDLHFLTIGSLSRPVPDGQQLQELKRATGPGNH